MKEHLIKNILDEYWLKPSSIILTFCISILCCLPFFPMDPNQIVRDNELKKFLIIIFVAIVINIFYIILVVNNNYIVKSKNKTIGVLWAINAESKSEYDDTRRKLGESFRDFLPKEFSVIFIPYHRMNTLKDISEDKQKKLLIKKKCTIMVFVKLFIDSNGQQNLYELDVSTGILHVKFEENVKMHFLGECEKLFKHIHKSKYRSENKIKLLQVTADKLALACRYIVGVSMFYSGYLLYASKILDDLGKKFSNKESMSDYESYIFSLLQPRRYELHITLSNIYSLIYQIDFSHSEYLEQMNYHLEAANKVCNNEYDYLLSKAFYYVIAEHDIECARVCIDECKKSKRKEWKYSEAFLSAYMNQSPSTIYNKYKRAFSNEYNLLYLIDFIENYLHIKPDKVGLYFALGLLYLEVGDDSLAIINFNKYIEHYTNCDKVLDILKNRCNINIEIGA